MLKGRHFLTLRDFSPEEVRFLLDLAKRLKQESKMGGPFARPLEGKVLAMIFEKPSTRTRVSFEVAIYKLGGLPIVLSPGELQVSRGETLRDTACVLSRYVDGILARVCSHESLEELAAHSSVPVINGLSDRYHPTQLVADLLTVEEKLGRLSGVKVVFVGDAGNNVAHSWLFAASKVGMDLVLCAPNDRRFLPREGDLAEAKAQAERTGGKIKIVSNPREAVRGADVIYTDVWISMGMESEADRRRRALEAYRVTKDLLEATGKDTTIFMHCLPAHRGEEVEDEVIDSEASAVFDQAENRLYAHEAILCALL